MIRRRAPMRRSLGTVIPDAMRRRVMSRDGRCVGSWLMGGACIGSDELDHVRASGAMGMKSVTCDCNLVRLCWGHHRYKTEHGREVRPILLGWLARFGYSEHPDQHADPQTQEAHSLRRDQRRLA